MSLKAHWQEAWQGADAQAKSWYQPVPERSLELIEAAAIARHEALIDVGGGASTLVDALLARGFANISVMDLSNAALGQAKDRLGEQADSIKWLCADATDWHPAHPFRLWHDRAVFHFLTEAADRARYRAIAEAAIVSGGYLLIATFAKDGPQKCSGLEVRRYDAAMLAEEFGPAFELVQEALEAHTTPGGTTQRFQYALMRRT